MVHYNFSSYDYYLNSYTGQDADDNYFGRLQMKIRSHTGQDTKSMAISADDLPLISVLALNKVKMVN